MNERERRRKQHRDRLMKKVEIREEARQLHGVSIESFTVADWCPDDKAETPPEAVAIVMEISNPSMTLIFRAKTQDAVDRLILQLRESADRVFGSERN